MYHQQGDAFSTTVEYYTRIIVVYKDGVKVSEERVPDRTGRGCNEKGIIIKGYSGFIM